MTALLRVFCPAKVNLSLKVLGLRSDGYHEIETVMQSVSLQDVLNLQRGPGLSVGCSHPLVPAGEDNLVYKAASRLRQRYAPEAGAAIYIEKNIPLAAGLAGGSSDAAGAIRGLNRLWNLNLSREEMLEVASEVGSDVPFCLEGGTALATGRGERVFSLPSLTDCWMVLVTPPLEVSTAQVYRAYRREYGDPDWDTGRLLAAIQAGDRAGLAECLHNDLERVTEAWYGEIGSIKREMRELGMRGVLMSGSGPTVFGLADDREQAVRAAEQLRLRYRDVFVVVTLEPQELEANNMGMGDSNEPAAIGAGQA